MSELAQAYYQERAERYGLEAPDVLDGVQRRLLHRDTAIAIHAPNKNDMDWVGRGYAEILLHAGLFVQAIAQQKIEGSRFDTIDYITRYNRAHTSNVVEKMLFPAWLHAGKIQDVRIEAIASDEVDERQRHRALKSGSPMVGGEDAEAYFLTTADLISGRRNLGGLAVLTIVGVYQASRQDQTILTPYYRGAPSRKNDLLAESGYRQSRAISTVIDVWGGKSEVVQPVRRGKSDRKSGPGKH